MLSSRFAANGALSYVAGTQYDIPDDLALQFIGAGVAVDVGNSRAVANSTQRDEPTPAEGIAQIALVSGNGKYAYGSLVIDQLPNNSLTDTIATEQQMAVATIQGGLFGPRSRLEVNATGQCSGASATKSVGFKAGPVGGSLATATLFGGTGGLTAQYVGSKAIIWGNGTLGNQRASPSGPINWASTNAGSIVTLGIDTEMDWNIYVYFTAGSTGGANSFLLRSFWAQWVG
jgi:hypothetical protein